MGIIRPRKDRIKEQAEHPGMTKYRIFYKDDAGKKKTVKIFWAKDDHAANDELEIFTKCIPFVDPVDTKKYYYGEVNRIVHDLGNGMEEEFDDIHESLDLGKESFLDKLDCFFERLKLKWKQLVNFSKDLCFWLRHYDKTSGKSHQRHESWNLDSSMLDLLEFNIPVLLEDISSVPNEFCIEARAALKGISLEDAEKSYASNSNPTDKELDLGTELWKKSLAELLLHVRLYSHYSNYGIPSPKDSLEYIELRKNYPIPCKPGTDGDIDYFALHALIQNEWNAIWDWWKKHGQSCWI